MTTKIELFSTFKLLEPANLHKNANKTGKNEAFSGTSKPFLTFFDTWVIFAPKL
jgi:hypothetical protein